MGMKLPTLPVMVVKTKRDVICGKVLWEGQCQRSLEVVKFRLDIFMVVVVVMRVYATECTEGICLVE